MHTILHTTVTGADTFTFLLLHACGARKLEAFICVLILTMAICFFINVAYAQPDAVAVASVHTAPTRMRVHALVIQSTVAKRKQPQRR